MEPYTDDSGETEVSEAGAGPLVDEDVCLVTMMSGLVCGKL